MRFCHRGRVPRVYGAEETAEGRRSVLQHGACDVIWSSPAGQDIVHMTFGAFRWGWVGKGQSQMDDRSCSSGPTTFGVEARAAAACVCVCVEVYLRRTKWPSDNQIVGRFECGSPSDQG